MSECEHCGHDSDTKASDSERLMHYRRALYMACGDDKVMVLRLMRATAIDALRAQEGEG